MRLTTTASLLLVTFTVSSVPLLARSMRPIQATRSPLTAEQRVGPTAKSAADRAAYIGSSDVVFPHLAIGGFWETELVVLNMGSTTVAFKQFFYDQAGNPLTVTIKSLPDGQTETTSAIDASLAPGERFTFLLTGPSDQNPKVGWSYLDYNPNNQRLGGFAVFRTYGVPNRVDLEATVPLSAYDDYYFYMPYDNMDGFVTTMALLNPADTQNTNVTATVLDQDSNVLETKTLTLTPGQQLAFEIPKTFATTSNRMGTIVFQGSTNRLSALGFRFNNPSGGSFTTTPVLNWPGNF